MLVNGLEVGLAGIKPHLDGFDRTASRVARTTSDDEPAPAPDKVPAPSEQRGGEAGATVAHGTDEEVGTLLDIFA